MKQRFLLGLFLLAATAHFSGCSTTHFRFDNSPPVWRIPDQRPIPVPGTTKYIRADYYYKVLVRRPAVTIFNYAPVNRSKDVNSHDHVPASSWFTPRLGYQDISPRELLSGPQEIGPPQPPVRVVRAKHLGSNPGFIIADSRDRLYLIKFDPPNFPAVETTTAFIVNRLFWGFGYNVPEDYTFYFHSNDLPIDPTADITEEEVKLVFSAVAPPVNGVYRATASLLIDGIYLGPIADTGVRKDDPNDRFPHQDRRVLRALRVFCAFTNQTDIRIDNSLDVYVGQPGEGFIKHYFLDFGEAFGGHGAEHDRLWSGYRHMFSFRELFQNLFTLGLKFEPWEKIKYTPWKSVAAFESEFFRPQDWKETYPFEPLRRARADDEYWAAKIIAALTREHIETLVRAANYPEPGAAEYIIETLMQRRRKIIEYYFQQVSPVEYVGFSGGELLLKDFGTLYLERLSQSSRYEIRFLDDSNKEIAPAKWIAGDKTRFTVNITPGIMRAAGQYLRLQVRTWRGNSPAPRSAHFHIRPGDDGELMVAGIVH